MLITVTVDGHLLDCEQPLHKSVELLAFLRQLCFVTQMNKKTEGGSSVF